MFFGKAIFLLVTFLLCHEKLLVAQDASMLRTFGILVAYHQKFMFEEKLMQLLQNESWNIERKKERTRSKIYRDRLLSLVRDTAFKDFSNRAV